MSVGAGCVRAAARGLALLALTGMVSGCIVYSVASTAVSVTGTVLETSADIVGGAVDLVVPDGDDDDDEE